MYVAKTRRHSFQEVLGRTICPAGSGFAGGSFPSVRMTVAGGCPNSPLPPILIRRKAMNRRHDAHLVGTSLHMRDDIGRVDRDVPAIGTCATRYVPYDGIPGTDIPPSPTLDSAS
jgi:hypothetical protein